MGSAEWRTSKREPVDLAHDRTRGAPWACVSDARRLSQIVHSCMAGLDEMTSRESLGCEEQYLRPGTDFSEFAFDNNTGWLMGDHIVLDRRRKVPLADHPRTQRDTSRSTIDSGTALCVALRRCLRIRHGFRCCGQRSYHRTNVGTYCQHLQSGANGSGGHMSSARLVDTSAP